MSNFAPYIPSQISDIVGLTQALNDRVTGDAAYDAFVQKDAYNAFVSATNTALAGKQPTIPPGTTAQYYRGDKTWQTLNASAVAGLSTVASSGAYADLSGKPALDDATVSAQDPSSGATVRTLRATLSNLWAAITARADQTLSNLSSAATARFNLGLGNVDNTSDASKQSSFQTAFDGRYGVLGNPTNWNTPFKVSTVGTVGPGTVSINGGGANMTGVGTSFLTTFKKGDTLTVGATTFTVNTVTSDTLLAVTTLAAATLTNQPYSYASGERLAVQINGRTALGGVAAQAAALTLPAAIGGDDALILRDTTSGANARFFFTSPLGSAPDLNISAGRIWLQGRMVLAGGITEINASHSINAGANTLTLQSRLLQLSTDVANTVVFQSGSNNDTIIRGYNNVRPIQLCPAGGNVMVGQTVSNSIFSVAQPTNGLGTVSNTAGGTTVTGVGTSFLTTFKPGDSITINGETVVISAIASNTSMTTAVINNANTGAAYTLVGGVRFSLNGSGVATFDAGAIPTGIGNNTIFDVRANGGSVFSITPRSNSTEAIWSMFGSPFLSAVNSQWVISSRPLVTAQGLLFGDSVSMSCTGSGGTGTVFLNSRNYDGTVRNGPVVIGANTTALPSGSTSQTNHVVEIARPLVVHRSISTETPLSVRGTISQSAPLVTLSQYTVGGTPTEVPVATIDAEIPNPTLATYSGRLKLGARDYNATRTGMTIDADGSQTKLAFFGANPISKPALNAAATDLSSTIALTNQIRQALIDFGLAQ